MTVAVGEAAVAEVGAVAGAAVVVAVGAEPRMTGTWWRIQVPVVVTRRAPGRVPLSN
ncbi:hypothetical protein [Nocardia sp. XZ_19_231]|uniref:hypothetical protein n=1 Tax=Nocardia sp. XZ_19_231 TaxID=2769252 RepID=UPI00188E3D28|nr:hypothetical protein [Nocardia sp. XZ_19_231]